MKEDIVEAMRLLAAKGHSGQYRRGPGRIPYLEHPKAVVNLLKKWGVTDEVTLAVAWGHDLFEDTDITEEDIHAAIPDEGTADAIVMDIMALTNPDEHNKAAHIKQIARKGTQRAILVKCADRICNTKDFLAAGRILKAKSYLTDAKPVFDAVNLDVAKDEFDLWMDIIEREEDPFQ